MLRFIIKNKWRDQTSGAEGEDLRTLDIDVPELQDALTDKYAKLRKDVPLAIEEAKAEGGINHRAQMIADLLADYDRRGEALRWTAGALQMACETEVPIREADGISINNETRTVAQILDAADAALAQEQGGSDA